jgi:hypothetical protein
MHVNVYAVLSRAVEEGIGYGILHAHKHTDAPTDASLTEEVLNAVMLEICEVFEFNDPLDTP